MTPADNNKEGVQELPTSVHRLNEKLGLFDRTIQVVTADGKLLTVAIQTEQGHTVCLGAQMSGTRKKENLLDPPEITEFSGYVTNIKGGPSSAEASIPHAVLGDQPHIEVTDSYSKQRIDGGNYNQFVIKPPNPEIKQVKVTRRTIALQDGSANVLAIALDSPADTSSPSEMIIAVECNHGGKTRVLKIGDTMGQGIKDVAGQSKRTNSFVAESIADLANTRGSFADRHLSEPTLNVIGGFSLVKPVDPAVPDSFSIQIQPLKQSAPLMRLA